MEVVGNEDQTIELCTSTARHRIRKDAGTQHKHELPLSKEGDDHNHDSALKDCQKSSIRCMYKTGKNYRRSFSMGVPAMQWIRVYEKKNFVKDVIAGLTVGCMIIPQSMSYAKIAGLPVEFGLYSSFLPIYSYALFGTSLQLAIGPVARMSLTMEAGLSKIVDPTENVVEYTRLAIQTSLLVGIICILLGIFKLGFITIFLSHSVISGFTSGAAIIIALSQAKYFLGYSVKRTDKIHELLYDILSKSNEINYQVFLMGMITLLFLTITKRIGKTYPKFRLIRFAGPLIVTVISVCISYLFQIESRGFDVVGKIPRGLPRTTISYWFPMNFDVIPTAVTCALVGFMESVAIAKQLASLHGYEIDSNVEFVGLGMANFIGAMFHSYPVTGSFSRSAVNNECGAASPFSSIITASLVGMALVFLTQIFEIMPLSTLAAIIISGVVSVIDDNEARRLLRVNRGDFCVWCISFFGTLCLGVVTGISVAIISSLLHVLYQLAHPQVYELGRLKGTTFYRSLNEYSGVEVYDNILLLGVNTPLYFANVQHVKDTIKNLISSKDYSDSTSIKFIVMDFSAVPFIDASALKLLSKMKYEYDVIGCSFYICNPRLNVIKSMERCGFFDLLGAKNFFVTMHDAVDICLHKLELQSGLSNDRKYGSC